MGEARYLHAAERTLAACYAGLSKAPAAHASLLAALRAYLQPPPVAVLRGPTDELDLWQRRLQPVCPDAALCLAIPADATGLPQALSRPVRTHVSAQLCQGVNCLPEIVQIDDLLAIFSQ